ncbi:MAG TPA: tetratricopeptide repeat protein [Pyrinomonadaceae bacterium]|nr:tetratricopeptide repeat protein [Pyrinomonadaceae bacterium]
MKNIMFTKSITTLILVFTTACTVTAQPGSYESEMRYGREYLAAKNYVSAQVDFQLAIAAKPDSAEAHFLFAQALLGNGETDKARAEFKKAAALDSSYGSQAAELLGEQRTPQSNRSKTRQTSNLDADGLAIYKVGDSVEVSEAGRWVAGVVTNVEGAGRSVRVTVKYVFNGSDYEEARNYNGIRQASNPVSEASQATQNSTSDALDFGEYVCEEGLRATGYTPKGYFTLKANGNYSYPAQNSSGRFEFDEASGEITWLSGYFANFESTTTFKSGTRVSQIDITFHTKNGDLYWSCGHNK